MSNIKNIFHLGWSHGQHFDYWSFVHFLTGIILGIGATIISSQHFLSFIFILVALILYEYIEVLVKVSEGFRNIFLDIVVGSLGSALAIFLLPKIVPEQSIFGMLGISIALCLILVYYGWKNFLKRKTSKDGSSKLVLSALYFIYFFGILIALASFFYWLA